MRIYYDNILLYIITYLSFYIRNLPGYKTDCLKIYPNIIHLESSTVALLHLHLVSAMTNCNILRYDGYDQLDIDWR